MRFLGHGVGKIYLDKDDIQAAHGATPAELEIVVQKPSQQAAA
jgi:hypothetical protein